MLSTESWENEEEERDIWSDGISLSTKSYVWWSPAFLKMDEHLPASGSNEWIPCFTLPIELSLSQIKVFFYSFNSLSYPTGGSKWASMWAELPAGVKPGHTQTRLEKQGFPQYFHVCGTLYGSLKVEKDQYFSKGLRYRNRQNLSVVLYNKQ